MCGGSENFSRGMITYPHPVWPLCTEAKTLETKTNAGLASTLCIWLLVAFLKKMRSNERGSTGSGEIGVLMEAK